MKPIVALMLLCLGTAAFAETRVPDSRAEITLSFRSIVERTAPAIVNIYAKQVLEDRRSPFADDPFFGQFFGFQSRPRIQNSLGSGVLLSADGLVVTNEHVIGNAREIRAIMADRREYEADVLLSDAETDIAVLQLKDARDLPFVSIGDSDATAVGDLVLAIGNPFGVGQTVTSGIISGVARSGGATPERSYLIQTDAAINPGNSGGALVNMAGQLVGVNTSILTRSGGSNGIGFAVPSSLVSVLVDQAQMGFDRAQKPWVGAIVQPVDFDVAMAMGMPIPNGAIISQVHPQSPFATAGLQVGDVILSVDDFEVSSDAELEFRLLVANSDEVTIKFRRLEAEREVMVESAPAPDTPKSEPVLITANSPLRGLQVSGINPSVIELLNLPLESTGVVVLSTDGYASRFGLRAGDVIAGINGEAVESTTDIRRLAQSPTRVWSIDLLRGGQRTQLRFRI